MPMQLLTIIQLTGLFLIYSCISVFLPALIFYPKFKSETFQARFMIYLTIGNFYIINIVLFLQILHISNRFTLIVFSVVPAFLAAVRVYRLKPVSGVKGAIKSFAYFIKGTAGPRLIVGKIVKRALKGVKGLFRHFLKFVSSSFVEIACVFFVAGLVLYIYGTDALRAYGYKATDLPLHNFWINEMSKNNIFVDGIYPFGYHCIVYYIHAVFGVRTFVILRLFGVVQTLFICLATLAFLRGCLKSKFAPYMAVSIYIAGGFYSISTYERYTWSLPQEFGMIFILPSIYFIYRFFEERKAEILAEPKETRKERKLRKKEKRAAKKETRAEKKSARAERKETRAEKKSARAGKKTADIKAKRKEEAKFGGDENARPSDLSLTHEPDEDDGDMYVHMSFLEDKSLDADLIRESLGAVRDLMDIYGDGDGAADAGAADFKDLNSPVEDKEDLAPPGGAYEEGASERRVDEDGENWKNEKGEINEEDAADSGVKNGEKLKKGYVRTLTKNFMIKAASLKKFAADAVIECRSKIAGSAFAARVARFGGAVAKLWRVRSNLFLSLFAMCFSLTLAVHFYDTMIAGLFCIGIAGGYFFRLFRKKYFGRVMLAGVASVVIAVLPMAVSYIGGTPLQGSLMWGMSIISGGGQEDGGQDKGGDVSEEDAGSAASGDVARNIGAANGAGVASSEAAKDGGGAGTPDFEALSRMVLNKAYSIAEGVYKRVKVLDGYFRGNLFDYVLFDAPDGIKEIIYMSVWLTMLLALVLFLGRDKDYPARIISSGVCIFLHFCVMCASQLGIPAIMDLNRIGIYIAYLLTIPIAYMLDAPLYLILGFLKHKIFINFASFAASAAIAAVIVSYGYVKEPYESDPLETNGSITCLTNIISENPRETYTICSANDEMHMVEEYGYHYEIIRFLREMEGDKYEDRLTIPTKKVYFFIEKRPIDYTMPYDKSGQYVSVNGASNPLLFVNGLGVYEGEYRWMTMSRMYYWALEFQKLYGREMQVYYESKDFICFVVEQNPYRLFDFSIDYGYNTKNWILH